MKKFICIILIICFAGTANALEFYKNGDRNLPKIAITIDDCYRRDIVDAMIDTAIDNNAKLTFFIVGKTLAEDYQKLLYKMLDNGFEIGNHSNRHCNMSTWDYKKIKYDLNRFQEKLDNVLGFRYKPNLVRFPYGIGGHAPGLLNYKLACKELDYKYSIYWDVVLDTKERMLKRIKNGSIVLFHANKKDLKVLGEILPELAKSYELVTVSELLGFPNVSYDKRAQ